MKSSSYLRFQAAPTTATGQGRDKEAFPILLSQITPKHSAGVSASYYVIALHLEEDASGPGFLRVSICVAARWLSEKPLLTSFELSPSFNQVGTEGRNLKD